MFIDETATGFRELTSSLHGRDTHESAPIQPSRSSTPLALLQLTFLPLTAPYAFTKLVPYEFEQHFKKYSTVRGVFFGGLCFLLALPTAALASATPFVLRYGLHSQPRWDTVNILLAAYSAALFFSSLLVYMKQAEFFILQIKNSVKEHPVTTLLGAVLPGVLAGVPLLAMAIESLEAIPAIGTALAYVLGTGNAIIYGTFYSIKLKECAHDLYSRNLQCKIDIDRYVFLLEHLTNNKQNAHDNLIINPTDSSLDFKEILQQTEKAIKKSEKKQEIYFYQSFAFKYKFEFYLQKFCTVLASFFVLIPFAYTAYQAVDFIFSSDSLYYEFLYGLIFSAWTGIFFLQTLLHYSLNIKRCHYAADTENSEKNSQVHWYKAFALASACSVLTIAWQTFWEALPHVNAEMTILSVFAITIATLATYHVNYSIALEQIFETDLERHYNVYDKPVSSTTINMDGQIDSQNITLANPPVISHSKESSMIYTLLFTRNSQALLLPDATHGRRRRYSDDGEETEFSTLGYSSSPPKPLN